MVRCPFCYSSNVSGIRVSKYEKVYECNDCGTGFRNYSKERTYGEDPETIRAYTLRVKCKAEDQFEEKLANREK